MKTSVFKDILDHSISGKKIYGGVIDYLEGLTVDNLIVPSDSLAYQGTGRIDGRDFLIGTFDPIGSIVGKVISIRPTSGEPSANLYVKNGDGLNLARIGQIDDSPYIELFGPGDETKISFNMEKSFIFNKLLIGGTTEDVDGAFRVVGGSRFDTIMAETMSVIDIQLSGDIYTNIGTLRNTISLVNELYGWYGVVNPIHIERLNEDGDDEVAQLANINDTILSHQTWTYLGAVDQSLAKAADVQFKSIICTVTGTAFLAANGDVSARSGLFKGGVDPNLDFVSSSPETMIKKYQERTYSVPYKIGNNWTGNVDIRFVVVGKLCTFSFIHNNGATPGFLELQNSSVASTLNEKLIVDLSDVSKFDCIYQSGSNVQLRNIIYPFYVETIVIATGTMNTAYALPPIDIVGSRVLEIGNVSSLATFPVPITNFTFTKPSGPPVWCGLAMHSPTFTWLTK
jgi:hypothetical protein